ncbi:MAG TPA: hypothetical protein VJH96_01290 [Patescibacteria group bacterium]|nr:hypothetical protein [Patescibacteria group bacterium]
MKRILLIFIVRVVFLLGIAALAIQFIPYKGFFPYRDTLPLYRLPRIIYSFANFDGLHYLSIAKEGYHQYEQAFFPLYPILIRFISPIFGGNYLTAGLIISYISFFIGIYCIYRLAILFRRELSPNWLLAFLLLFPTAFFTGAVYTEGLFFMLVTLSLYFLKKKNYIRAAIFSAFASATRLIGVGLFFPFLFMFPFRKHRAKSFLLLLSPFVGLFSYMLYLWKSTGDPLFFVNAQPAFGASRSTQLIFLPQVYFRYVKIFFTARFDFSYFIAIVESVFFTFAFVICIVELLLTLKKKDYFLASLACFSLFNLLVPSLTGTFSSIPRYTLMSFSIFFYLSRLQNVATKTIIAIIFGAMQITLLSFFIQGYFVS